jgi:hypothetical protein
MLQCMDRRQDESIGESYSGIVSGWRRRIVEGKAKQAMERVWRHGKYHHWPVSGHQQSDPSLCVPVPNLGLLMVGRTEP